VHLTELAHTKIEDPSQALTIGQKIDAQVINIDIDERRIGLSVKALLPIDKETLARIKAEQAAEEEEKAKAEEEKPKAKKEEKAEKEEKPKAKKEEKEAEQLSLDVGDAPDAAFVASSSGKKYYSIDSAGGKKIKEEKRVYFKDEKEAEAAGYSA
ncbi:MAG: S1 RNA-binding domain-containing protein, partial [Candidatus Peribacter sp.]|nr:S1 RNA-binding domain-containing protein [Candidatus Peribacter sp.]